METKLDRINQVSAKLAVEVPATRVNEELASYFKAVSKFAKIQGFRQGKAPLNLIKKMYGQEASQEITQRLVSDSLKEIVREHNLHIILPPTLLAVDSPEENRNFHFEAELDLKPEIPKINLEDLEVEGPEKQIVTDALIEEELEKIRKNFAHYHPLIEDRGAVATDLVKVKYEGFVDGTKVERASVDEQDLPLGTEQVSSDFENAVLGLKKNDKKDFEIEFSADHQVEEVRGRKVQFRLEVLDIQKQHIPDWNEERIQQVNADAKSIDDLKAWLKEDLESRFEHQHQKQMHDQVGDALIKKYPIEINARQKKMTSESILRDSIQRMLRMGMSKEEIENQQKEMMEAAAESAEQQIKLAYLLEGVATQNEIRVDEKDVEKRLQKTAQLTGHSLAEIKEFYSHKEEGEAYSRIDRLRLDILDEKSLDYALSKARIKVKEVK